MFRPGSVVPATALVPVISWGWSSSGARADSKAAVSARELVRAMCRATPLSCAALALTLMMFEYRVLQSTLALLPLLLSYGRLLFLALCGFNGLLWATGASSRTPFFQPSAGTVISLAGFVLLLVGPRIRRAVGN